MYTMAQQEQVQDWVFIEACVENVVSGKNFVIIVNKPIFPDACLS